MYTMNMRVVQFSHRSLVLLLFVLGAAWAFGYSFKASGSGGKSEFSARQGYISLFRISENMGADLSFDAVLGEVRITREKRSLLFLPGRTEVVFGKDRVYQLDKPPVVEKGEVLIPLAALRIVFRELALPGESWVIHRSGLKDGNSRDDDLHIPTIPASSKINVVFIDAGHGGRDPGAVGYRGLRESRLVLKVAKRVTTRLRKILPGVKVVLIRKQNRTISLNKRAAIANRYIKKGFRGVFVSIHANACRFPGRSGFETYYLSPRASNAESRATAAMENGALAVDGGSVPGGTMGGILSKMLVEEYRRESLSLAQHIQGGMKQRIGKFSRDRGVKKANFFVMRGVYMPSVLVEIGFVTNPREARFLSRASYRDQVSIGISAGIRNFVSSSSKK